MTCAGRHQFALCLCRLIRREHVVRHFSLRRGQTLQCRSGGHHWNGKSGRASARRRERIKPHYRQGKTDMGKKRYENGPAGQNTGRRCSPPCAPDGAQALEFGQGLAIAKKAVVLCPRATDDTRLNSLVDFAQAH
jgi:hypothetical protein